MDSGRRNALRSIGGAAIALPVSLLGARQAFARTLDQLALEHTAADQFNNLAQHYLLDPTVTYLNHASIGTMPKIVFDARERYLRACELNPWEHMWGGEWEDPREAVRQDCATLLNCHSSEIALTHNTTETFNLLANGLPLTNPDEVLFSSLNHPGASVAFQHAAKRRGFSTRQFEFPVGQVTRMSTEDVVQCYVDQISDQTKLLVFPHIDNIVGLRYPVAAIAKAARARGVQYIAVDAAQSVGMLPVDMQQLGVDAYAASPHKWLQAPKGLGLAFVSQRIQAELEPMWVTWGQADWGNSARKYEDYGTRNLAEVLSLGDAIAFHRKIDPQQREARLMSLRHHIRQRAEEHAGTAWLSANESGLATAICAVGVTENAKTLAQRLFQERKIVLRGFASSAINAIRLSPNVFTSRAEVDRVFDFLRPA